MNSPGVPLSETVKVRVSARTRAELERRAGAAHVAVGTFIRALILDALAAPAHNGPAEDALEGRP